jgi:hypothetical protein
MSVSYSVTVDGCTFLLDGRGVCRRVLLRDQPRSVYATDTNLGRTRPETARRCLGAQYVASLDVRVEGALVPMPWVGVPMLFAATGEDGRIAIIRTGPVLHFEAVSELASGSSEWSAQPAGGEKRAAPSHKSGARTKPLPPLPRPPTVSGEYPRQGRHAPPQPLPRYAIQPTQTVSLPRVRPPAKRAGFGGSR